MRQRTIQERALKAAAMSGRWVPNRDLEVDTVIHCHRYEQMYRGSGLAAQPVWFVELTGVYVMWVNRKREIDAKTPPTG